MVLAREEHQHYWAYQGVYLLPHFAAKLYTCKCGAAQLYLDREAWEGARGKGLPAQPALPRAEGRQA